MSHRNELKWGNTSTNGTAKNFAGWSPAGLPVEIAPASGAEIAAGTVDSKPITPAGLSTSGVLHYRGSYSSPAALSSSVPTAFAGDYALVDVAAANAQLYIWDATDNSWVLSGSALPAGTANQILSMDAAGAAAEFRTLQLGTTAQSNNLGLVYAAGSITLHVPDASATARGVLSAGAQTIAGAKTFANPPLFTGFTTGSVLFAGASGLLSQDNTNFFWDNTNKRLSIGFGTSPLNKIEILGTTGTGIRMRTTTASEPASFFGSNASIRGFSLIAHGTSEAGLVGLVLTDQVDFFSSGNNGMVIKTEANAPIVLGTFHSTDLANARRMTITTAGIGFGSISSPTAKAHFPAHSATAGSAPIKLTSGTAMTATEDGALEYHASHLFFTIGSTRFQLDQQSSGGSAHIIEDEGTPLTARGTLNFVGAGVTVTDDGSNKTIVTITGSAGGNPTSGSGITVTGGTQVHWGGALTQAATITGAQVITLGNTGSPITSLLAEASNMFSFLAGSNKISISSSAGIFLDVGSDVNGDIYQRGPGANLERLAAVATGNVLISGGVASVNSWGKVGLTTHVTGVLPVANGGTGLTALGTANQLAGVNSAATAVEYKTLQLGTTAQSNDLGIVHAANLITIHVPDASNVVRGVITAAAQVIGGAKTFTSFPIFSSGTSSRIPYFTTGGQITDNASLLTTGTRVTIGHTSSPTAMLHLGASTSGTNGAALKFNSGVVLTTPEAGVIEYNGTHLYVTLADGLRYQLDQQSAGSSGHVIQDEGTPLTARPNLNFVGNGVNASDNGTDTTTVTILSTGHIIQDESTSMTQRNTLSFVGAGVTVTDDGTNFKTIVTIPGGGGGITLGAIGSTPNANALTLTGSVLNVEPASASFGGVVTTGTQTFAGSKTFNAAPLLSTMTSGSVLFAGASGVISQDNANFHWDAGTVRLGIGANAAQMGGNTSITAIRSVDGIAVGFWVVNSSSGTNAISALRMANNIGNAFDFRMHSSTAGAGLANAALLFSSGSGGLIISTESTQTIYIRNNLGSPRTFLSFTNTGIGAGTISAPTAQLHFPGHTATAGSAPIKLTSGTAMTTAENGALEYHSSHLYFTIGSTRFQLDQQGGGGGITNTAANTELMMSDGTNATPSGMFKLGTANLQLGSTSLTGANRIILAETSGVSCDLVLRAKNASSHIYLNDSVLVDGGNVSIGSSGVPTRKLQVESRHATTTTVEYAMRLVRNSSASTGVGVGVGIELGAQVQGTQNKIGATIEAITTNVGAGTEVFDLVFKTMTGGAAPAERLRISGAGILTLVTAPANDDALTQVLVRDNATGLIKYRSAGSIGGGGGGITNTAANTELMMSNGTNAISSGIFATAASGSLTLGSVSIAGDRTITAASSSANSSIAIAAKANGTITLTTATSVYLASSTNGLHYDTLNNDLTSLNNRTLRLRAHNNTLQLGGGNTTTVNITSSLVAPITQVSANTTLDNTHHTVLVNASGAARTITLPAASTVGRIYIIKKIDSSVNNVTIDPNGSETIDGDTTHILTAEWASVILQSDGSNWQILAVR